MVRGEAATQRVELRAGPNYVSLRVAPADVSLDGVFGDAIEHVFLVKDSEGTVFVPSHELRALTGWKWGEAIFVSALEPFTLEVTGDRIESKSELALPAGWSWVPTFLDAPMAVEDALASIASALTRVDDGAGRVYPKNGSAPVLKTLQPGRGYRVHLSRPSTLVYPAPSTPPPPTTLTEVPTVLDAIAVTGLEIGDKVEVEGFREKGDGGAGVFEMTSSGCVPDGGTCLVPTEHTEAGEPYSSKYSFALYGDDIQWESFRLCHSTSRTSSDSQVAEGDGCYDALQLHGHGASNKGGKVFEPATGRVSISSPMRNYASSYDGDNSGAHTSSYRYATSELRLERIVDEPLVLEGERTTFYTRPEWWGGQSDRGDATDAIAWALEAAEAKAVALDHEHFVVLSGMYSYSTILETQQGTVLKGLRDGVRDGQGLQVLAGAPWHYFAVKDWVTDPMYREPATERDALLANMDPKVHVRHGRETDFARVVDVEIDGNLAENDFIFSDEYEDASGQAGNSLWPNRVREMTRNTPHYNGFVGANAGDTPSNSNARLENVHIHGFGGNGILSNDWTHFGGSRDLKIGDIVNNHPMYGVPTSDEWIEGIEITGFFWKAAISVYSGNYRDVSYLECEKNPYGDGLESVFDIRNDNPDPGSYGQWKKHFFGQTVVVEGFTASFTDMCYPQSGYGVIQYTRGPTTFRNVNILGQAEQFKLVGSRWAPDNQSQFTLENVTVEGAVTSLSGTGAGRQRIHGVTSTPASISGGEMFVFRPQTGESQIVTVYDTHMDARVSRLFKLWPSGSADGTSFALYVKDSSFEASDTIQLKGAPESAVFYLRNTAFSDWDDGLMSSRREWFDDVTVEEHGGRSSDASGSVTSKALSTDSDGTRYIDVDPGLFYAPQDASFVGVTGRDASRFLGWSNVGSKYDPILRMSFSGTRAVSIDWTAAIRPIPASVVFPD